MAPVVGGFRVALPFLSLALPAFGLNYSPRVGLGVMNKHGVTRYSYASLETRHSNTFHFADPGNDRRADANGATDFAENLTWGWHHPNGLYNTIPVGAPLIDGDQNIYLGSDDAIRKFSVAGELIWSYGPRGQLAAAPSLVSATSRREAFFDDLEDADQEAELRPDALKEEDVGLIQGIKIGDRLKVRPGMYYEADQKEFYKAGDIGEVKDIIHDENEETTKFVISWARTGHESVANAKALNKRFQRVNQQQRLGASESMLVGSTTSGYVFAVSLATGQELWAIQTSKEIHGVKGVVSSKSGIVLAATDRCKDRYCYRYRNLENPLAPGNSMVRGLSVTDGSAVWSFKPDSPVWNFVPQYSIKDSSVLFSDIEGTTYSLNLATGALLWKSEGVMGTYTQAFAVLCPHHNIISAMGLKPYEERECNPHQAPGILPQCGTFSGSPGWAKGYNASSGHKVWEIDLPEPPSSGAVGMLNSPKGHTRLVIALGHNCWYGSSSQIWAVDPNSGGVRWEKKGPTLWTSQCAGDKEGGDIRRAMGGRAACQPGAWSTPAIDKHGDVYIGSQVGELQRWGVPGLGVTGTHASEVQLLSSLSTGVAFQDQGIGFGSSIMAVATCTSLIVFSTYNDNATIISNSSLEIPFGADKSVYGDAM